MKVLVATEKPFAPAAINGIKGTLEEAGHDVTLLEKYTDHEDLLHAIEETEALIVRSDKITRDVLDHAPKMKIIVRAGAGYDNIDIAYAKQKGIVVENTPGQNSNAVAELVFGLLVYAIRNFYNGKSGRELKGKKLGILAFGNVGRNVARIAKGFGMEVFAYDAYCPTEAIEASGVKAVENIETLFSSCDVVSLHIPATEETKRSIGQKLVAQMKKDAILVNTARKEIIDEDGLLTVLRERGDLKYVTDIMPDTDNEFQKLTGRYFSTPKKMGAQTSEANTNAGLAAANQINAYFSEGSTKYQVNR